MFSNEFSVQSQTLVQLFRSTSIERIQNILVKLFFKILYFRKDTIAKLKELVLIKSDEEEEAYKSLSKKLRYINLM